MKNKKPLRNSAKNETQEQTLKAGVKHIMTQNPNFDNARDVIRAALKVKLQAICNELAELDTVFSALDLKGSRADLNIRTAAIALNAARVTA